MRRRSSSSPSSGCRRRSSPSAPARRRSRPTTPRPRRRRASARRCRASARRWATSVSRSSGPRTRRPRCRPAPAPSTSSSPRVRSTTRPRSTRVTTSPASSTPSAPTTEVEAELARLKSRQQAAGDRGRRRRHPRRLREAGHRARDQRGRPGMIVRILGEGQYDVGDHALDALNGLDHQIELAIESGDEEMFRTALAGLLAGVRSNGTAPRRGQPRRVRPDPAAGRCQHRRGPRASRR